MLIDLQPFDVDVGHDVCDRGRDHKSPRPRLRREVTAEGMRSDDNGTCTGNRREYDNEVPVDAMEDEEFISDDGDKLEDNLYAREVVRVDF